MLESFVGSYNETGLQSLQEEDDLGRVCRSLKDGAVTFWAVLESEVVPNIRRAMRTGDRQTALAILANCAKDAGRILG